MNFSGSALYLLLFSVSTFAIYMGIRRNWTKVLWTAIAGSLVNSYCFVMYSLTAGNGIVHALTVGLGLGTFFAVAAIIMASYFKVNDQMPAAVQVQQDQTTKRAA
jgi:hypothetical protein